MTLLNAAEKEFLDVFLYEATTSPFTGPATKALHAIGVEYGDISFINWAYNKGVSRDSFAWGHPADASPPLPWANRDEALHRNQEVRSVWEQQHLPTHAPST